MYFSDLNYLEIFTSPRTCVCLHLCNTLGPGMIISIKRRIESVSISSASVTALWGNPLRRNITLRSPLTLCLPPPGHSTGYPDTDTQAGTETLHWVLHRFAIFTSDLGVRFVICYLWLWHGSAGEQLQEVWRGAEESQGEDSEQQHGGGRHGASEGGEEEGGRTHQLPDSKFKLEVRQHLNKHEEMRSYFR